MIAMIGGEEREPEASESTRRHTSTATIELNSDSQPQSDHYDLHHSYALRKCGELRSPLWSDALSGCQEHFRQSTSGRLGANVEAAWEVTRGTGVNVLVVDTPVDYRHEDLAANFDLGRSPFLAGTDFDSVSPHGTKMASIIAARDNTVGMRGVAPRATLNWYSINRFMIDGPDGYWKYAEDRWLETTMQAAVINHSWSRSQFSQAIRDTAKVNQHSVFDRLSVHGFGRLGTLNVVSGGKTARWPELNYSSLAEYRSHPAVVVACSTTEEGTRSGAGYNTSLRGPGLWVCSMPGGIAAVHQNRYLVNTGWHSSPSTAMVSGVAALVRAANPGLTWRDVKLILAESAQHNDPDSAGWQEAGRKRTNADERYRYHHSFGFGVIDAGAAVELALNWVTLPEYLKEQHTTSMESTAIPDDGSEVSDTINAISGIDFVEYVQAELDLAAPNFRDLQVELVSPSGTISVLSEPAPKVGKGMDSYDCDREGNCPISGKFRFGSAVHLGEAASGAWKLRISDEKENGHLNTLKSWRLKLFGHNTQTPTDDDGPTPTVTVTGGQAATEGGAVSFTFAASPTPTVPLTVSLEVSSDGAYGAWTGSRIVTVPTSGSVTLAMPTTDDSVAEPDGSVTVTLSTGTGYTVSSSAGSASVVVSDDDVPEVSVAAGSGVVEGAAASFTLTATPKPAADLDVTIAVSQDGDFGVTTGARTVTIPASGSFTLTVATSDDSTEEADGSVTAVVATGAGYSVSASAGSASVAIADDEGPPAVVGTCVSALAGDRSITGQWTDSCDSVGRGGRYARFFTFTLAQQATVRIDLESSADTYLFLRRGLGRDGQELYRNDDGGDGYNSRIAESLAAGDYTVEATTFNPSIAGAFTLSLDGLTAQTPPVALPEISIAAGGSVVEGAAVSFTVSATPTPAVDLDVTVVVSQSGDFGVTTGSRTVTIPVSGSETFVVATTNDSADEADGAVTAAVSAGTGYTVASGGGSATVAVADDDVPEISIVAGGGVAEGGDAEFTLTASPVPAAGLDVTVAVSQSGDFGAATGLRTVTVPTSGSFTLTVATSDDSDDEADGSVTATVGAAAGYTVSSLSGAASVAVSDDDDGACSVVLPDDAVTVDEVTAWRDALSSAAAAGVKRFNRVLAALGTDTGHTPMTAAQAQGVADWLGNSRWDRIARTLAAVERAQCDVEPQVSIAAGGAVTEGGDASFTVTATPEPSADLDVTVTVSQSGDFGVTAGSRTVTIPASGSQSFTVATANDAVDEPDGSATAAISAGSGYTVSSSAGSATVAVSDDDDPPPAEPQISVAAGSGVTEGTAATFTVTAGPAPAASLDVSVTVSQSGDFAATGERMVTIPTTGSATFTVATTNDITDEPDGSVTATIDTGAGYTVSSSAGSATVAVSDDDDPPPAEPQISVAAGSGVTEGTAATFTVTAGPAPAASLDVSVTVSQSGDFAATGERMVTIPTTGSATFTVATTNDITDEPDGSVTATIDTGAGYTVSSSAGSATVAVSDDDDPPPPPPPPPPPADCVSDETLGSARDYYELHRDRAPGYGRNWLRVLVAFGDVVDDQLTAFTAAEALEREQRWFGWRPFREALECIEAARQTPPPPVEPEISIAAGNGITEGSTATFTLTASPAPTAALTVDVTVSQSGDFGVTTGARTVAIPTTGTFTLSMATTGDSVDEADGSVTVTVDTGTGYTVSSSAGSATVAVADDDDPAPPPPPPPPAEPQISIVAGGDVTEGTAATFTLTASPAPTASLEISVTVSQSGDFAATGERTVSIPMTGSATFTVATTDDTTDEADGSVTATVGSGTGYTVSSSAAAATVAVSDNDDDPPPPPAGPPTVTVSDATAAEDAQSLAFVVTLSKPNPDPITFRYGGYGRTATLWQDWSIDYRRTFTLAAGETSIKITVPIIDDDTPENDETLRIYVYATSGIVIRSGFIYATGTITDND